MTATIEANGLRFAYIEEGEGPLVLCMHGFPDTAETWRALLPKLAAAGYRAVAPYMRGYPPSEAPADGSYSALDLGRDVVALIEAFGVARARLIGHDWGSLAVYCAANLAPERIEKMVTLAIPHPRVIKPSLKVLWKARHFITFLFRKRTIRALKRNDFAEVDTIYRRWSPTWDFGPEELVAVKKAFAEPGAVEAALGYYWSFAADARGARAREVRPVIGRRTEVPTLCLVGEADGALDVGLVHGSGQAFTGSYDYVVIPRVGHFLHREAPDVVHKAILDFLGRAGPAGA